MNTELMFSSKTDLWSTPQELFDELNAEFGFNLDACAIPENAKCDEYYTPEQNGLLQHWYGTVWCNPLYGREVWKWVAKAAQAAKFGATVVMLLPTRTDTKWFHEYIYGKCEIRFIKGRLKFGGCKMKHLGDITKLSGYTLPVVDVITGGSPCQDLSVAGKRTGLDGERSGLFMEQIRIVKEMRQHDRDNGRADELLRPRYMVWENVPGAFSSNGGKDFQAVLTEIVRIADPKAPDVPMPDKGKWSKSGCLYDDMGRWSIAWRVHDAQFWGVPQRRKRIALVADFGGLSAPEILFERKGLSRYPEPCGKEGQSTARNSEASLGDAVTLRIRGGCEGGGKGALVQNERSGTLGCNQGGTCVVEPLRERERESCERDHGRLYANQCGTSSNSTGERLQRSADCDEICLEPRSPDGEPRVYRGISPTLNTAQGGQRLPCVIE